jgi:hypothetical protein
MEDLMSEAKKLTNKHRLEQWTAIIQECINSGKRVNEWCSENNISRDSYNYWLRKVKLATAEKKAELALAQLPKIVPLIPPAPVNKSNNDRTAIILRVNGVTLEIQDCASDTIIERTLKVLQRIC